MNRTHLKRTLLASAALLLVASTAYADPPTTNAKPQGAAEKAGEKTDKALEKAGDKAEKAGDKAKDTAVDAKDKAKDLGDRASRKAKQHDEQKAKLTATLKTPMDEALKQELRRHAERVAKIERIKSVSTDAKDKDTTEKADKLLTKEKARHDKWMEKRAAQPSTTTPAAATPTTADKKEGAK